jgi:manganese/iron transport system permease protein
MCQAERSDRIPILSRCSVNEHAMFHWLYDPLTYDFVRNAIAMGIIIGILCPVVGSYLIVQRMALLGDVIAHCVLPGLSIALATGIDVLVGGFSSGILGALFITWLRRQSRIKVDSAMALTFSTFFALGVTLISVLGKGMALDSLLFGEILGVTLVDIGRTLAIALVILVLVASTYKEVAFYTFDAVGAQAMGLPVNGIQIGLMVVTTLTIIASMRAVGVILVIALLIGPALTAYLLVQELYQMMMLGAILGAIDSVLGIYASYYWGLPSGPAIVLVSSVIFLLVLGIRPLWRSRLLTRPTG